jgi:hypothetical protein
MLAEFLRFGATLDNARVFQIQRAEASDIARSPWDGSKTIFSRIIVGTFSADVYREQPIKAVCGLFVGNLSEASRCIVLLRRDVPQA